MVQNIYISSLTCWDICVETQLRHIVFRLYNEQTYALTGGKPVADRFFISLYSLLDQLLFRATKGNVVQQYAGGKEFKFVPM